MYEIIRLTSAPVFQHALRLLAFHHINNLLQMDSLMVSKTSTYNRKRRSDKVDEVEGEGKKEKKDLHV